jgi:hypothetical protein
MDDDMDGHMDRRVEHAAVASAIGRPSGERA